jgi:hypothetical protein
VSIRPCSIHGRQISGKLATLYSSWPDSEGQWKRQKQFICAPCLTELLAFLQDGHSEMSLDVCVCPKCGSDSSANLSPIYLWLFPPKREKREYALTTCESCAPSLQGSLLDGSIPLPDRQGFAVGADGPNTDEWAGF